MRKANPLRVGFFIVKGKRIFTVQFAVLMKEVFLDYLTNFSAFTPEQREQLAHILIEKNIPKKTILIGAGTVANSFFLSSKERFVRTCLKKGRILPTIFSSRIALPLTTRHYTGRNHLHSI
ncbi:MAG: hypothetical protein ACFB15_02590 [Cyclobacteriaceae bacterium]